MNSFSDSIMETLQRQPAVAKLLDTYANLAPRDQLALRVLGGFLLPVILLFGVIMPATDFMNTRLDIYRQAKDDYQWIDVNKAAVSSVSRAGPREPGQSLFGLANATSKGFQIGFKRYEPAGENALNLWMESISFNNLVLWLERLEKRHGVVVREIAVERLDDEGLVNVRLVLQG